MNYNAFFINLIEIDMMMMVIMITLMVKKIIVITKNLRYSKMC